ncbi:MAG: hypothetical protein JXN64_07445 [Spirochaetes bacterium]|nr:hypothetical protein [Spirochaetota bacterium]
MKIILNYLFFFALAVFIFLSGCSRDLQKRGGDFREADDENTTYLLSLIEKAGANSPHTLNANFSIEGHSGKQNFKATGNAKYNNNPKKVRIIFHDAVFKSPITEIIQDADIIKIFFTFDNVLYIDNAKTIDLKFYSNLDLDFNLISDLVNGRIPVINDFSVVKGLESGLSSGKGDIKFIILENKEYYETISFKRDIADKILWMNKNTKEKIEIYLNEPFRNQDIVFYKSVRIVSLKYDLKMTINFTTVKFNMPVDLENMVKLELPKDIKIINRSYINKL